MTTTAMNNDTHRAARGDMISVEIRSAAELDGLLMPFIRRGGLFVAAGSLGETRHDLGDEVHVALSITDIDLRLKIAARVVWIAPANGARQSGIGVQFDEKDGPDTTRRLRRLYEESR